MLLGFLPPVAGRDANLVDKSQVNSPQLDTIAVHEPSLAHDRLAVDKAPIKRVVITKNEVTEVIMAE